MQMFSNDNDYQMYSDNKSFISKKKILFLFSMFMIIGVICYYNKDKVLTSLHEDDGRSCSDYSIILGASWGSTDITKLVSNMYSKGEKTFQASEDVFGDDDVSTNRTLTIVWK